MDISTILSVTIAIIAVGVLIYHIIKGKAEAKDIVISLVVEAERRWIEKGQGAYKYAYVVGQIKAWMPTFLKPFFPDAVLNIMIQEALEYMKKELSKDVTPKLEEKK